jgi:xanthine dehydrogenase YagS FAD-binding subunit
VNPFIYLNATDKDSTLALLENQWGKTEILAGGTDLIALMKDDILTPSRVLNIKRVTELHTLTVDRADGLRAGCLVTLDEMARNAGVQQLYPALATAIADAASPQIRNMATLGGNLCQRPRCWYFRNGYGLLAIDSKGKSLVLQGDNRHHAILGNSGPAYFVSPSTIAPVLIALGATVAIAGPKNSRTIPLESFFRVPASEQEREHNLQPNELVTAVSVPPPGGSSTAYYEVRQKHGFDWPVATATVVLTTVGKKVTTASVVLGHVAPTPWRSKEAESLLAGQTVDPNVAASASDAALKPAKSLGQNGYKIQVAKVALKRAILQASGFDVPPPHPALVPRS